MPEYLSPAVYVEEVDTGSKPIEGVSTSTAGMVGVTERGPMDVPILVTSLAEYQRIFGQMLDPGFYPEPHCYFPHAISGFFTNRGQRAYIVRTLDVPGSVRAHTILFDRGDATSANTLILRTADAGDGVAGTPLVYVLDSADVDVSTVIVPAWYRIGDGSDAEYRQVLSMQSDQVVSLDQILSRSHDAGAPIEEFTRAPNTTVAFTAPGGFGLVAAINNAGTSIIEVIHGTPGDTALLAPSQLLAVGDDELREEYRFIVRVQIDATNPARAQIELDAPLAFTYPVGARVSVLEAPGAGAPEALETTAQAGSNLVFLVANAAGFTQDQLAVIDRGVVGVQEVRRIGLFGAVDITPGAYERYAAGTPARVVTAAQSVETGGPPRVVNGAVLNIDDTTLEISDVTNLAIGHALRITDGLGAEDVVFITGITAGVGTIADIDFDPPLNNTYAINDPIIRLFATRLTQDAQAGATTVSVDRRADVAENRILQIGDAPNDEYIRISDLPNANPAAPPDSGNITLEHLLRRAHAAGDVIYSLDAAVDTADRTYMSLALSATEDAGTLRVSDGGATGGTPTNIRTGDILELQSSTGERFYHRVGLDFVAAASVERVELSAPPLTRAHGIGAAFAGRGPLLEIEAIDYGIWGDRLRIAVEDEPSGLVNGAQLELANVFSPTRIRPSSILGIEPGSILEFGQDATVVGDLVKVDAVDRRTGHVTLALPGLSGAHTSALTLTNPLEIRSREFQLHVYLLRQPDAAVPTRNETIWDSEHFRNLSMDPRHPRYVETIIGDIDGELRTWDRRPQGESQYIRVRDVNQNNNVRLGPEALIDVLPSGRQVPARRALEGGIDALPSHADVVGQDADEPENRTGIQSLRNYEEISLVAAPGHDEAVIQQALIDHCESERFRFAVLDSPPPPNDSLTDVRTQRQMFDTKYAALYYPWLHIPDPFPTNLADIRDYPIPPVGHVLGVYARTDVERGVHKAPANELVYGITGLRRTINKREHDILNPSPSNINVIRDFRDNNRGIRVWGGRVITSDTDWKYVNVRRLLIFIEHSIERGLQWVVFEPNVDATWARVRRAISSFLTVVWRNGGLEGLTVEEAYFVKCDRTTMTQTDIDNGRLICHVGVAPVKPAEFVIIRIGLWTAHADTE